MRVLVTGASGFAGAMLAARLLGEGHEVQALARSPDRAYAAIASALLRERSPVAATRRARRGDSTIAAGTRSAATSGCRALRASVVAGDVTDDRRLRRALDGVEVAYFLIHSMERSPAGETASFAQREREAALRFGEGAVRAGVRRIVYLGGLAPRGWAPSRHLASRVEVERVLLGAVPDSLALRASIVIGARSRSFRLLVHLIERLPFLALPPWRAFRTQPIDGRDLLEMLVRALEANVRGARSLDVAGPDVVSYQQLLERIADLMVVGRPRLRLGVGGSGVTARLAAALAGEDPELTSALMAGLAGDLLPRRPAAYAAALLGVRLHDLDAAVEHALREWEATEPLAAR